MCPTIEPYSSRALCVSPGFRSTNHLQTANSAASDAENADPLNSLCACAPWYYVTIAFCATLMYDTLRCEGWRAAPIERTCRSVLRHRREPYVPSGASLRDAESATRILSLMIQRQAVSVAVPRRDREGKVGWTLCWRLVRPDPDLAVGVPTTLVRATKPRRGRGRLSVRVQGKPSREMDRGAGDRS